MKNLLAGICLVALGCGTSDPSFQDDESDIGQVEQAFSGASHDYGFSKNSPFALCPTGARCLVPRDRTVNFAMGFNTTFAAGFTLADAFNDEINGSSSVCFVLRNQGWTCGSTTGSSNEVVDNNTLPSGVLSRVVIDNILGTVFIDPSTSTYQKYNACHITVSKTNIEARSDYQALSTANKRKAVRNVIKNTVGHCVGLPDNVAGIMRPNSLNMDNPSFTLPELNDLRNYVP